MKVVVLGAELAGVPTAYYLAKDGHEVTVIERPSAAALETSFANGSLLASVMPNRLLPHPRAASFFSVMAPSGIAGLTGGHSSHRLSRRARGYPGMLQAPAHLLKEHSNITRGHAIPFHHGNDGRIEQHLI
jgi:glycine/D-amino acid oxidase-like deaminating enzyme